MSFEMLVKRISPTVKRIAHKLNGHYTFFNDEDLFQEAMVHLWVDFRKGILFDKTDSYILQGCYYHLKNYIRKTKDNAILISLSEPVGEDGAAMEDILPGDDINQQAYLESKVEIGNAEDKCLTKREKEVLYYFMEGMSMREIGKKIGTSHVMVLKIRNRIKDKYIKYGLCPPDSTAPSKPDA